MQQGKVVVAGLVDVPRCPQAELSIERLTRYTAFFENIGEGPEGKIVNVAIAGTNGFRERRANVRRVAKAICAGDIPFRPKQREMRIRGGIDLATHMGH